MNNHPATHHADSSTTADRRAMLAGIGGLAAGALLVGSKTAHAGPLNPPGGPVVSTGKTLTEVEPRIAISPTNTPGNATSLFRISQPGSYYLTGNITGVVGKHGIEIAASGVTLDLNGFDLAGVPGMGAFDGVSVTVDGLRNISVRNGSVRNWGDGGIDLGFLSRGCRVEGLLASGNIGTGINTSISSTVTNCTAAFNGQRGIRASNGSTISNCSVESNTGTGIEVNNGCTISGCSAYLNGTVGILTGPGCTVLDCAAFQNSVNGVQLGEGGTITRCSAVNSTGNGIQIGPNSFADHCTASQNTGNGIAAGTRCMVSSCTVALNSGDGIRVSGFCLVVANHCASNGQSTGNGAGIHATGTANRIEGNYCLGADRGVQVADTGNIIIRNSCRGNTFDWDIAGGNFLGPIVVCGTISSVSGRGPFPSTLTTTDPHANFST